MANLDHTEAAQAGDKGWQRVSRQEKPKTEVPLGKTRIPGRVGNQLAFRQPARAVAAWAASHHVALADSWGWVEEKPKGSKSGVQMFGLARLAAADIISLMAMSGQGGIFLDAPRDVVRSSVEWLEKPGSESPAALLERALRLAPALGLATQGGRIGLRQSQGRKPGGAASMANPACAFELEPGGGPDRFECGV